MQIRRYQIVDCTETLALFTTTVRKVNAADYTPVQIDAWLHGSADDARWGQSLSRHYTLVATSGSQIVGFGDIDETGYLDRLFVHHLFGRRGIATALVNELELYASGLGVLQVTTHASITAKPFFEKRGYTVVKAPQVVREGITLQNYVMQKAI